MAAFTTSRVGLGIALILIGSVAANMLDVMIRLMQSTEFVEGEKAFKSFEIMTTRTLWGLPLVILFAIIDTTVSARRGGMGWRWRFPGYPVAILRSFLYLNIATGFFFALAYMPVGNVTLLFFVYPLFITVLSVPILGDSVGWWRGSAVFVGFIGIACVAVAMSVDPLANEQSVEGSIPWWAYVLPLWSGFCYALAQICMRFVPREVPGMLISLYTQGLAGVWCILILLASALIYGNANPVGSLDTLVRSLEVPNILWGFVFFGAFSMAFLSQAFRFAPAVILGPLDYIAVLGAYVFGYLILNDLPPTNSPTSLTLFISGAALIIGSGLIIVYRELIRKQPLAATVTAGEAV